MKRLFYSTFVILVTLSIIVTLNSTQPDFAVLSMPETIQSLKQLHERAEREDAQQIAASIQKIKEKEARKESGQENPGILLEAMADLKTSRRGYTYRPNYKIQALTAAKQFNTAKQADELPWQERGPGNVSGRVRTVIADVSDETGNTWFAATIGGGIWKTTDAGATWINASPEMSTLTTTSIVQSASDPDIFYAGTGMGYGRVVDLEGSGIYKSIDHGETWMQLESTANGELLEAINRIVVDPVNPDVVVVCSNDSFSHLGVEEGPRNSGIFRTTDGGKTWDQVFDSNAFFGPSTDNRVQQIVADPSNFDNLYATVNEVGVIKSTDGGETWQVSANTFALPSDIGNPSGNGFGLAGISVRTEMAIAPGDPSRIYAAVERPRGIADLYMSTNAGATWQLVNDTGNDPNWFNGNGQSGATGAYTAGWFDNTIAVHPTNPDIVYVGGVNIYRIDVTSENATRTTTPIAWRVPNGSGVAVVHADHHWLEIIDIGNGNFTILNANDGGVAFSHDGGTTWTERRGMITTQFYGVDKKPGESAYFGGTQDNGSWISGTDPDTRSNWQFVIGGDGFETVWNYNNPNLLLGGSQNNGLRRSSDGGQTWTAISAQAAGFAPFITKIANSKADPDLVFAIGSNGVLRSDNFGETWTLTPVSSNWIGYRPFDNVEVSNADPQVVWISSRLDVDPPSGIQGGIHVSNDAGLTFTNISDNFPPILREASGIATDPIEPHTAYMLFAGPGEPKVLKTEDLGQTWRDLSGFDGAANRGPVLSSNGFPDVAVFSMIAMPFDTNILWAGTEIGLYVSVDGGETWGPANNGFPNVAIFEMSIVDDEILVATQGRGILTVQLPELEGYEPPTATLSPRLRRLAMQPTGSLAITIGLPSPYDSSFVIRDEGTIRLAANNTALDTTLLVPVVEAEMVTYEITSYKDGKAFRSSKQSIETFPATPRYNYANQLDAPASDEDFTGNGFQVATLVGFNSGAIHTNHPYGQAQDFFYTLKTPIIVGASDALFTYDDVVLVEEGLTSDYTDPNFFDYVIVEGTKDGTTWLPLLSGYDSSVDPTWSQAYQAGLSGFDSNTPGDASMFRPHTINLLDTFEPDDTIFIRFRLHSDPLAVAWGWAIDNIMIQPDVVSVEQDAPLQASTRLEASYPNPFKHSTSIPFFLQSDSYVSLSVYDIQGRKIIDLMHDGLYSQGEHRLIYTAKNLASGLYFYKLTARPAHGGSVVYSEVRSMTLMR